ncbi:MAG: Sec-independent protein translocase protein TatB [Acidiferrobacterales bacterium]
MFDIGFSELVLIGLIALIVLGPERLPEVARTAGRWVARVRRFIEDVKHDIDREVNDENLAAFRKVHEELTETRNIMERSTRETLSSFSEPLRLDAPVAQPETPVIESAEKISGPSPAKRPKSSARKQNSPGRKKSPARKSAPARSAGPKKTTRNGNGGIKKTRSR